MPSDPFPSVEDIWRAGLSPTRPHAAPPLSRSAEQGSPPRPPEAVRTTQVVETPAGPPVEASIATGPKPKTEVRTKTLKVRLSPSELAEWERYAVAEGKPLSVLVRRNFQERVDYLRARTDYP